MTQGQNKPIGPTDLDKVLTAEQIEFGHAERLIGSIRRECLDHAVVFGEAHLRRITAAYTGYYNECRTHLSLDKDSPNHRSIRRLGQLVARPIFGGFHHQYCRIWFLVRTPSPGRYRNVSDD